MINMKLCVMLMMMTSVLVECNNLTKDMPGVCVPRRVPSVDRHRHRKNRTEKLVCCQGWIFENDSCKPVCRFGCVNGTCVGPDDCQCAPPLMLANNACIPPSCDPGCVNSDCVGINTCKCHEGFHTHNATHCIPACPDGFINDPVECMPVCEIPCVNAICTAPDICTCLPGYVAINDTYCGPVCNTPCTNAECSAPDTCTCLPGYERLDKFTCKPTCESHCPNGVCVAPNTCACLEGYVMEKGVCSPVCESPCAFGRCTEPNKCTCFEGYHNDLNNIFNCLPTCEPDCVNSSCVSPNTCQCNPGYEPINGTHCKPICKGCVNGDCVGPNNCECHEGYKNVGGRCNPECTESCVNGYCSAPNTCTCSEGYIKNSASSHVCYKPCKGPCENGYCDRHGECFCNSGFELKEETCIPAEQKDCKVCNGNCTEIGCLCPDGTTCSIPPASPEEIASSTSMAGLELTWMLGGAIGVLLIVLMLVVIQRMWSKRKQYEAKAPNDGGVYGSVVYSHTPQGNLITKPSDPEVSEGFFEDVSTDPEVPTANDQLLGQRVVIEDEQL